MIIDTEPYVAALKALEQAEIAMSELYSACADMLPHQAEFWTDIAAQEMSHAAAVHEMLRIFQEHPNEFRPGKPFNATAINTFIRGINEYTAQVKAGLIISPQIFYIAADLEKSLFERDFYRFLDSDNLQFYNIVKQMLHDVKTHSQVITSAIIKHQ